MFGWDHKISADPNEMAVIVRGAHRIHAALGTTRRIVSPVENERKTSYRRSIVSARPIKAGERMDSTSITFRRPARGLDPNLAPLISRMVAAHDIEADTVLSFEDLKIAPTT